MSSKGKDAGYGKSVRLYPNVQHDLEKLRCNSCQFRNKKAS